MRDIRLEDQHERQKITDARTELDYVHKQKKRAQFDANREAMETSTKFIREGNSFGSLDPELRAKLTVPQENSLRLMAIQITSGVPPVTNWEEYNRLSDLNTEDMANVDLGIAFTQLAPPQFARIETMVLEARGRGKAEARSFSANQVFSAFIAGPGSDFAGNTTAKKKIRGELRTMYQQDVEIAELNNGPNKRLSNAQHREILATLIKEVEVPDFLFGFIDVDMPLFEVEVPPDRRPGIIRDIRAKGRVPSEALIRQTWIRFLEAEE